MNWQPAKIEELDGVAAELLGLLGRPGVVCFDAPMGAGKTTLISALCRRLGVADDVASPTFSIINEYRDAEDEAVYHFDFYRIDTPEQLHELGVEDYFYSGRWCFVEWPELAGELLPAGSPTVRITSDHVIELLQTT